MSVHHHSIKARRRSYTIEQGLLILLSSYPKGSSYKEKKEKKRLELKLHFSELPFLNFSVRSEEKVT